MYMYSVVHKAVVLLRHLGVGLVVRCGQTPNGSVRGKDTGWVYGGV